MISITNKAPVVKKVDSAIHLINHYPLDDAIGFAMAYPLDSELSVGKRYPSFKQLEPGLFKSNHTLNCTP